MKESKERELQALQKDSADQIKYNDEESKRNVDKLELEKKKKGDELRALMTSHNAEEEKCRGTLATTIRQQYNEKITEYDSMMDLKTKEKEEKLVFSYRN